MQSSDVPSRFPIPFGNAAGGSYIRTIPEASQIGIQDGAASLTDGFPPLNFTPVGAGGVPPFGQDFNGLMKQVTQWSQWQAAGNATPWDSAFSTAIGGYPKGAVVAGTTAGVLWLSTTENNTANPNTGGAGWVQIASAPAVQSGIWNYAAAGGTADAITATLSPVPPAINAGFHVTVKTTATNTIVGPTLNVNGFGAATIVSQKGLALPPSSLPIGMCDFIWSGTAWVFLGIIVQPLQSAITLYVRTDGNDNNSGFVNSAGGAFATLQGAYNAVQSRYSANGYQVTFQLGIAGTYAGLAHTTWPGVIEVKGDVAAPASYLVTAGATFTATCFFVTAQSLIVTGVQMVAPAAGGCLSVVAGAARGQTCNWVGNAGAVPLQVISSGRCTLTGTHVISGGGGTFMLSRTGSSVFLGDPSSFTSFVGSLSGTPAFTTAFAQSNTASNIENASGSFTGSATGTRYIASTNGVINSNGGGASYFPGSVAGTTATGGQYV